VTDSKSGVPRATSADKWAVFLAGVALIVSIVSLYVANFRTTYSLKLFASTIDINLDDPPGESSIFVTFASLGNTSSVVSNAEARLWIPSDEELRGGPSGRWGWFSDPTFLESPFVLTPNTFKVVRIPFRTSDFGGHTLLSLAAVVGIRVVVLNGKGERHESTFPALYIQYEKARTTEGVLLGPYRPVLIPHSVDLFTSRVSSPDLTTLRNSRQ
jgi:hypothetical protein